MKKNNVDRLIEDMETIPSKDILVKMNMAGRKVFVNTSKDELIKTIRQEFASDAQTNYRVRFDQKARIAVLEEAHQGRPHDLTILSQRLRA